MPSPRCPKVDRKILGIQQRIDTLEAKARTAPVSSDMELQAQLARFLCVLSSGLIEQALIIILDNHANKKSQSRVAQYVSYQLSRIQNAKFEDILVTVGRFDPAWRDYIEKNTSSEVKDAIDSIVNNRNQISHGGQVGISLATFSEYYKSLKRFIEDLETLVDSQ
jgi:formyltetrahydrofolate hydrolase